ncbi:hypothetical protein DNK59_18970 [Pseudomonas sp. TKO26]|nr:hypothetical protein DNK62_18970 [Pseudomonas sp. TKO30]PYY85526.1 hypothetical protein DNK61_18350 [Pseudomonas sp. TKO29]PYY87709.1 hypothetical protein DNK59_18970 [Pseudomonas sp. TKO26]PYY98571.1 hypothetical protein DNK60_19820 [Pseudomonas sp. TKO14]
MELGAWSLELGAWSLELLAVFKWLFVARELAPAGLRSSPKSWRRIASVVMGLRPNREQAPSPQVREQNSYATRH